MLCKHFSAVIDAGKETFQNISPIFRLHPLHVIDNEIFDSRLCMDHLSHASVTQMPNEEDIMEEAIESTSISSSNEHENGGQTLVPLVQRRSFKKVKGMLCSNVKTFHQQCYNIKNVLFVEEVNEKVSKLIEMLNEHLTQENGLLIGWSSQRKRKSTNVSFQSLSRQKKVKHPYSGYYGETAEMMRQYYRAKWSLDDIEKQLAKVDNKQK